jgi:hypothetical protein
MQRNTSVDARSSIACLKFGWGARSECLSEQRVQPGVQKWRLFITGLSLSGGCSDIPRVTRGLWVWIFHRNVLSPKPWYPLEGVHGATIQNTATWTRTALKSCGRGLLFGIQSLWFHYPNKKLSYPRNRPWRLIGLWYVEDSTLSRPAMNNWRPAGLIGPPPCFRFILKNLNFTTVMT